MSKIAKWEHSGEAQYDTTIDYESGVMNARQVGPRAWQFVELIDMAPHGAGREDRYRAELKYVDLDKLPQKEIENALRSCGWERDEVGENARYLAEACVQYGLHAPLYSHVGSNRRECLRAVYREANALARDAQALSAALEKPVNAIGSTAAEFMRGDLDSALARGLAKGDTTAGIVAKMQDAATSECPTCGGSGAWSTPESCPVCQGRGKVMSTIGGMVPAPVRP